MNLKTDYFFVFISTQNKNINQKYIEMMIVTVMNGNGSHLSRESLQKNCCRRMGKPIARKYKTKFQVNFNKLIL